MCRQGLGMGFFVCLFVLRRGGGAMKRPLFENGIYVTLNVDNRGL